MTNDYPLYMDDLCECGHQNWEHFINEKTKGIWCGHELEDRVYRLYCSCHCFKLDNLRHIEILKEEKERAVHGG